MRKRVYTKGYVVNVIDGDTLEIRTENTIVKVRLIDIDCPEDGQYGHRQAKELLACYALRKHCDCIVMTEDKYGRAVARVWVNGEDLSKRLVAEGWAHVYDKYCHSFDMCQIQNKAMAAKRGIWAMGVPMVPWLFRKIRRERGKGFSG